MADAVLEARAGGIRQVSLDLLYDVPGQRLASWAETVEAALELAPDHLSCYALTLDDPDAEGLTGPLGDHLPTTAGARRWRERARAAQDEDRAAAAYALADAALEGAGMPWYELSNWAFPGAASRHNLAYWERRPYEAVGPGAHAFDGSQRRWNAARLDGWLGALTPAPGRPAMLPPGDERGHRRDDRRGRGAHPRVADRARGGAWPGPGPGGGDGVGLRGRPRGGERPASGFG